jgi:2-polyprenyl-3-methyl-5-hydroxy-6-metoxy-1,4-benzoquinol methylase
MPDWDTIYKTYNKGGKEWDKMKEGVLPYCFINGISPHFVDFVKKTKFSQEYALDIGCGNGKYLHYLAKLGFKTDGIDASTTSIEMTKKILSDKNSCIKKVNMFDMQIDKDKYDLIISISTINHGSKKDLSKLIEQIHKNLCTKGYTFITIPDKKCLETWDTFQKHEVLDENTIAPLIGPEKGIPHSFYTKTEIEGMFKNFSKLDMQTDVSGQWIIIATK